MVTSSLSALHVSAAQKFCPSQASSVSMPAESTTHQPIFRKGPGTRNSCFSASGHDFVCVCIVSLPTEFGALPIDGQLLCVG